MTFSDPENKQDSKESIRPFLFFRLAHFAACDFFHLVISPWRFPHRISETRSSRKQLGSRLKAWTISDHGSWQIQKKFCNLRFLSFFQKGFIFKKSLLVFLWTFCKWFQFFLKKGRVECPRHISFTLQDDGCRDSWRLHGSYWHMVPRWNFQRHPVDVKWLVGGFGLHVFLETAGLMTRIGRCSLISKWQVL